MARETKGTAGPRGDGEDARRPAQRLQLPGAASKRGAGYGEPGSPGEEPEGFAWKSAVVVAALVGGLVVWRTCTKGDEQAAPGPGGAASGSAAPGPASTAAAPPRCAPAGAAPFGVGDAPKAPRQDAAIDGGSVAGGSVAGGSVDGPPEDQLAPFAVEVGRGAAFDGGFAVAAMRQAEGGTVAMVATLGADGSGGKLLRLARSRGDLEPPVVTGIGGALLVAMLEPNAGGRAIKIARVEGEHVTWGAELSEGRDESLALDAAASGDRAVIVWDDVTRDGKWSRIMMASVEAGSLRSITSPRPISPPKIDGEMPRVAPRPGGYWLAYVARSEEGAKRKKKDEDEESAGEMIGHQWIEVAPLDETGSPTAVPRPVTPRDGHILAFDLTPGDDGGAIVAYRDDDTPSGSSGGRVSVVSIGLGGIGQPRVIAEEEVGSGVPTLVPGWIAVANVSGPTLLAAMGGNGELLDDLVVEGAMGSAEPIAASKGAVLLARPAGTAVKLEVLRCVAGVPRPKGADGEGGPAEGGRAEDPPAAPEERPMPPESADPPP